MYKIILFKENRDRIKETTENNLSVAFQIFEQYLRHDAFDKCSIVLWDIGNDELLKKISVCKKTDWTYSGGKIYANLYPSKFWRNELTSYRKMHKMKHYFMNLDISEALKQIDKSYIIFREKWLWMSKSQFKKVLEYGISRGYRTAAELSHDEVQHFR